ncbi:hypothetical protein EAF00_002349 [Botryotinia globosa]|nr:hypothetical protein EAF00_002349 [Botryotinia globosa]
MMGKYRLCSQGPSTCIFLLIKVFHMNAWTSGAACEDGRFDAEDGYRQVGRYLCIAVASALICFVSSQGVTSFYAWVMTVVVRDEKSLHVDSWRGISNIQQFDALFLLPLFERSLIRLGIFLSYQTLMRKVVW